MRKFILLIVFFNIQFFNAQAPANDILISRSFINYLIDEESYDESLKCISIAKKEESISHDSLQLFEATVFLKMKQLDSATKIFDQISSKSNLFFKSQLNAIFCQAYMGNHENVKKRLINLNSTNEFENEVLSIVNLYSNLLNNNYPKFDEDFKELEIQTEYLKPYFDYLNTYRNEYVEIKTKSPFLAGLFSAIIPGSGKFYAGYRKKALSSTFGVLPAGAVCAETLIKNGPRSPHFIVSSAFFLVFYTGNIVGSFYSVPIYKKEKLDELNKKVYIDIHHIIRRSF